MKKYKPIFRTGQTILESGHSGVNPNGLGIIINTYVGIRKYNYNFDISISYDERDTDHTIYCVYYENTDWAGWVWEKHCELYCSNVRRGKKILREHSAKIVKLQYSDEPAENVKAFIRSLRRNKNDPE